MGNLLEIGPQGMLAKDPVAPPPDSTFLKGQIPHATLEMLQGCGHSAMRENPSRCYRAVWPFLQAAESDSSR